MDSPPTTFFSYSRVDSEFVLRLAKDLRAAGAEVWLDQLDIGPGQRWDNAVQEALRRCPNQIVVLSPDSVSSENVMDEVSYGLDEHKQVIPIFYRECEMPFRLRRVQYIDFRAHYHRGLGGLLKALGVPEPADPLPIQLSGTQTTSQPLASPSGPSPGQAAHAEPAIEFSTPGPRERLIGLVAGAVHGTIMCLLFLKGQFWKEISEYYGVYPILSSAIAGAIAGFRPFVMLTALCGATLGWGAGYVVWHDTHHGAPESTLVGLICGFTPGVILGALVGVVYLRAISRRKR